MDIVIREIIALLKVAPDRATLVKARMKESGFDFSETTKPEFDEAARRAQAEVPGG